MPLDAVLQLWGLSGAGFAHPGGSDRGPVSHTPLDVYKRQVGLPNQGVLILYEVLNERQDALAERSYAVWPDLATLMRAAGVPQLTVDGHRAVRDFDVFGLSFPTELNYTNMLAALELAGIALRAAERGEQDPLVVVGGHASFNPEPVADFIDAAIIGDGEQAVLRATDLLREWKLQGKPGGRAEALARLAQQLSLIHI